MPRLTARCRRRTVIASSRLTCSEAPSCVRSPLIRLMSLRMRVISSWEVWVPIIHPCWSGSMPVLVKSAAESVSSADIEVRDPLRIGGRFG